MQRGLNDAEVLTSKIRDLLGRHFSYLGRM